MITSVLEYLEKFKNQFQFIYESPIGRLIVIGDDHTLKAILLAQEKYQNIKYEISKNKEQVFNCIKYLNLYFKNKNNLKIAASFSHFNRTIKIKNNISEGNDLILDMINFTDNEINIYLKLLDTQIGSLIPYKVLSEKAGIINGARFAGNVMSNNIFPIVIPCHRVVKSDSTIGNFSMGTDIKKYLIEYEANPFAPINNNRSNSKL